MDKAAHRIADAVSSGESIFIHGDYDVDGVTSTAVYVRALKRLGANPLYRVPHRKNDGYDLRIGSVEWAHSQAAKLVITTDCGIQAREAVKHANSLGMTVIVTDHHEQGDALPGRLRGGQPTASRLCVPVPGAGWRWGWRSRPCRRSCSLLKAGVEQGVYHEVSRPGRLRDDRRCHAAGG